jgi:hypothetical protein
MLRAVANGACALTVEDVAMCRGTNTFGRIGDGGDESSSVPVPVSGDLAFEGLSSAFSGTCGIAAGSAYCWG